MIVGWFWRLFDRFLSGLVERHFDSEGGRRRRRITRDEPD
jgi:hypothetical protein